LKELQVAKKVAAYEYNQEVTDRGIFPFSKCDELKLTFEIKQIL
jgi:hypothetical protein